MSIYDELIDKDSLGFIHQRNIWALVAKLIKMKKDSPSELGSKISVRETKSHDLKQSNGRFMVVRVFSFRSISMQHLKHLMFSLLKSNNKLH